MLALTYSSYQPESICSACGTLVTNYVEHCILWCHGNANLRHRMWIGLWHKYGIDLYLRLAGLTNDVFIDVLFGRYDIIADILNEAQKEEFYCFVARFIHGMKRLCGRLF